MIGEQENRYSVLEDNLQENDIHWLVQCIYRKIQST